MTAFFAYQTFWHWNLNYMCAQVNDDVFMTPAHTWNLYRISHIKSRCTYRSKVRYYFFGTMDQGRWHFHWHDEKILQTGKISHVLQDLWNTNTRLTVTLSDRLSLDEIFNINFFFLIFIFIIISMTHFPIWPIVKWLLLISQLTLILSP